MLQFVTFRHFNQFLHSDDNEILNVVTLNCCCSPGAALTVRPVRLEPPQYLRFTYRDHFLKSPKSAIKINQKNVLPLSLTNISEVAPPL